ncbi:hypothetical protein WICPIJ_002950 [Wickerhamomyces pijperi]|uniref:Uncharacterized protein n=1 Tax=Wickerhamomyces pijperi TaxID=599730 RepID=A0A9P8QAI0_WICPI|nr:hypothetical protein WICPIJ_002950 [Wickerhamomyces pijperi]
MDQQTRYLKDHSSLYSKISNEQHQLQQFTSPSNPLKKKLLLHYNAESQQLTTTNDIGIIGKLILQFSRQNNNIHNNSNNNSTKRIIGGSLDHQPAINNYISDYQCDSDADAGFDDSYMNYRLCYNSEGQRVTRYVGDDIEEEGNISDNETKDDFANEDNYGSVELDMKHILGGLDLNEESDVEEEVQLLFPSHGDENVDSKQSLEALQMIEEPICDVSMNDDIQDTTQVSCPLEDEEEEGFSQTTIFSKDLNREKHTNEDYEEESDVTSQHTALYEEDVLQGTKPESHTYTPVTAQESLPSQESSPYSPVAANPTIPILSQQIVTEETNQIFPPTCKTPTTQLISEETSGRSDSYISFKDLDVNPISSIASTIEKNMLLLETPTKSTIPSHTSSIVAKSDKEGKDEVTECKFVTPIKEDYNSMNIPYIVKLRKTPTNNKQTTDSQTSPQSGGVSNRVVSQLIRSFESTPVSSPLSSPTGIVNGFYPSRTSTETPSPKPTTAAATASLRPTLKSTYQSSSPLSTPLKITEPKLILNHITPIKSTTSQMLSKVSISTQTNTSSSSSSSPSNNRSKINDSSVKPATSRTNRVNIKEICQMFENQLLMNSPPKKPIHSVKDTTSSVDNDDEGNGTVIKRKLLKSNVIKSHIIYESV